ncbi:hypothetical protein [Chryseobacterium sp. GP-SGM7]|uniref:hypothetical protein n=1 Tax=Chryseobacterium sp. GP-SGM7 TaxID=3411323 RepID=UPI003B932FC9
MKNYFIIVLFFVICHNAKAQVGINTNDPKATLHIGPGVSTTVADGIIPPKLTGDELLARENRYGTDQDGAVVYVTQGRTSATNSVKTIGVTSRGLYIFDSQGSSTGTLPLSGLWVKVDAQQPAAPNTAYSARFSGNGTLLGLALLANKRTYLNLPQSTGSGKTVFIPSANVDSNGAYNVSETGLYRITYRYKETGISLNATGASIDIFKNDAVFSSAPMILVSLAFDTQIDNIYSLNAGDKITFGTVKTGLLALEVLNVINADIIIHRIK